MTTNLKTTRISQNANYQWQHDKSISVSLTAKNIETRIQIEKILKLDHSSRVRAKSGNTRKAHDGHGSANKGQQLDYLNTIRNPQKNDIPQVSRHN